jgi:selenide,water dikinase
MRFPASDRLIVGMDTADDAGVYRLDDTTALILTVDFFTPIVDDPYTFGAVSAANSLSDVYAMGGRPIAALNVCGFPPSEDKVLLRAILQGGADKVAEAGAVIAGGHSVRDEELKYGLAVVGIVHPDKVITNAGARPGDVLVLTKPLGTGLLSTARKKDAISEAEFEPAVRNMLLLNRAASEIMIEYGAHACTDITGFGLIGHAQEMACASERAFEIAYHDVPLLPLARECADKGHSPAGTRNNRAHFSGFVQGDVAEAWWSILFDPQTSGGLLISVASDHVESMLKKLERSGAPSAVIGKVLPEPAGRIILRP